MGILERSTALRRAGARWPWFVLTLALACGLTLDEEEEVPFDDLPRQWASAICDNMGPCCQRASFVEDASACRANGELTLRAYLEKMRGLGIAYDAIRAHACVGEIVALVRSCADDRKLVGICDGAFRGTLNIGESCSPNLDFRRRVLPDPCVAGASCFAAHGESTGQCAPSLGKHGKEGEPCVATCSAEAPCPDPAGPDVSAPHAGCFTSDGLYCAEAKVCAPLRALGEPCSSSEPCASDAICSAEVCVAKPTSGPCPVEGCGATAFCAAGRQCRPRAADGEPCANALCLSDDACDGRHVCRSRTVANELLCSGSPGAFLFY